MLHQLPESGEAAQWVPLQTLAVTAARQLALGARQGLAHAGAIAVAAEGGATVVLGADELVHVVLVPY